MLAPASIILLKRSRSSLAELLTLVCAVNEEAQTENKKAIVNIALVNLEIFLIIFLLSILIVDKFPKKEIRINVQSGLISEKPTDREVYASGLCIP